MTEAEKTTIVNEVLSAIRTNSVTIGQLTPVTTLGEDDWFEVSDGRKVKYSVLRDLISALFSDEQGDLRSAIGRNVLSGASFSATENTVTLTIRSEGKTIVASAPIATESSSGMVTSMDKLKINTAYSTASAAQTLAGTAKSTADSALAAAGNAQAKADSAHTLAGNAQAKADSAHTLAGDAQAKAEEVSLKMTEMEEMTGEPGGIAVLDDQGRMPAGQMPLAYRKPVIMFDGIVDDVPLADTSLSSEPDGIVFDESIGRLLAMSGSGIVGGPVSDTYHVNWPNSDEYGTSEVNGIRPDSGKLLVDTRTRYMYLYNGSALVFLGKDYDSRVSELEATRYIYRLRAITGVAYGSVGERELDALYYDADEREFFVYKYGRRQPDAASGYYKEVVPDDAMYLDALFVCGARIYRYDDGVMADMGLTDKELAAATAPLLFVNYDELVRGDGSVAAGAATVNTTFASVLAVLSGAAYARYRMPGVVVTFTNEDREWETMQWKRGGLFADTDNWEPFGGGGAAVGNEFNVTVEVPLPGNSTIHYYSLCNSENTVYSAVHVTYQRKLARLGMRITFAVGMNSWKTYKYVGPTTDETDFTSPAYWVDEAAMSAGDEPFINVNMLCGHPGAYSSLAFALADIVQLEQSSGILYRKPNLVITYKVDDQRCETKQFVGNVNEFQTESLWHDFGGGGDVEIEAKDEPEEGGTDAFSTGGAAEYIPVDRSVTREGNETTITLLNAAGNPIFDPIVVVATGGGEGTGTAIGITAEKATVYAALGTPMVARFAIRSETIASASTTPNTIERIEIVDRDTNQTVHSWSGSLDSAASLDKEVGDWNYSVDLKDIFSTAAVKRLQIVATDENGKTATRVFNAVAEDITVTCRQSLDYNSGNHVAPTDAEASFDCYQFVNATSAVKAKVDIFVGGEWVNVHEKDLVDNNKNYTKSITVRPAALGLSHGSYMMRMYGTSLNSGVVGNTVYSTLFVVDPDSAQGLVGIRYDDRNNGLIRNYDTAVVEVAAYKKGNVTGLDVQVCENAHSFATVHVLGNQTLSVPRQITGHDNGDIVTLQAHMGAVFSPSVELEVQGSAVDVSLKENAAVHFDFASRSNSESDHTIESNGVTMNVRGANWRTNGFIDYLGEKALRVAENVQVTVPYAPFGLSSVEQTGMALQMRFATDNVADKDAVLFDCYNENTGAGFYIKGNEIGVGCFNGVRKLETRRFACGEQHTLAVVAEPGSIYETRSGVNYAHLYMYLDGEKIARIGYIPGKNPSDLLNTKNITIDGTHGDFYLYNLIGWRSHYEWSAAMSNYLAKMVDISKMKAEYDFEDVLRAQTAEDVQMMRPQIDAMLARGIGVCVFVGSQEDFDRFDNGTDTSEKFYFDVYYFDPIPWRSFISYHTEIRRQGTTSAKRSKKNWRIYCGKATSVVAMYPNYASEHSLTAEQLTDLQATFALFAMKYVRVTGSSIPVKIVTIKVDFSDSTGANDCGTCNMLNATFRSLAQTDRKYLTPAQRAFDGTWDKNDVHLTGLQMNHSTANAPCAVFRSVDNMQSCYFEAKGNWKEDKGEQVALGFVGTSGYNKGCKNWQDSDFKAVFGLKAGDEYDNVTLTANETLDEMEARFKAMDGLDTDQLYLLQPYCSRNYRFMRYRDGEWSASGGSMRQVNGRWVVTGDVLNPVNGWEMLNYTGMDWCQGIGSVDDLMAPSNEYSSWVLKLVNKGKITDGATVPAWTQYFECMVDNDDLALAYAKGQVVPFELYQFLRFTDAADYASKPDFAQVWHDSAWKYLSLLSNYVTRASEDYNSLRDSVSKNKQPMAFLEDGHCVVDGVYDPDIRHYYGFDESMNPCFITDYGNRIVRYYEDGTQTEIASFDTDSVESVDTNSEFAITAVQSPMVVYFNKVYDCDGANDKDNEGGGTGDPEEDPDRPTDVATGYENSYAGWGSVLFKTCVLQDTAVVDAIGTEVSYRSTVAAMRNCQVTLDDGSTLHPFSPEGALYYYVESRTKRWPKQVSSFDGWRKYEQYTATSDAIYFYALQGLGLASIPQYIRTRWRFRDGFYQTGDFFAQDGTISGRVSGSPTATIRIRAAKSGYFGIGNDASGNRTEVVYLEEGEGHTFTNFKRESGALLYIYQADRMSEIDLSDLTLGNTFEFSHMKLAKKILLGGEGHVNLPMAYDLLVAPVLGELPFLEEIDVRNTLVSGLNAERCPRLRHIHASGSQLASLQIAQTSPINDITLPDTMVEMKFVGLPNLTYTGLDSATGLSVPGMPNVGTIHLDDSPNMNGCRMLRDALRDQAGTLNLRTVRIVGGELRGTGEELTALITRTYLDANNQTAHVGGFENNAYTDKPVINGTYMLERLLEQSDVEAIEAGISGISVQIVLEAYIDRIDEINGEYYGGASEVGTVTFGNIGDHLLYYNGETYEEYVDRIADENRSIHDIINS